VIILPQIAFESKCIYETDLHPFCEAILVAAGMSRDHAATVAASLIDANLRGWDSHGIARLPHYLRRIQKGSINPRPTFRTETLGPAAARVDGDHGMGHLVMNHAAGEAIARAREAGAAWVSVCNSSHCGTLTFFGHQIAKAGMIGFAFTHVDPMVVPFGASEPFCGTNPICITAPGRDGQILCLDMATSVTPWNTIENASIEGVPIPKGWAVDAAGRETVDPAKVNAIHPFGGYKGSGLGLMIDVLCAMLSGSPYGPDIPKMYGDLSQKRQLGGLVGAIDITRFVPLEQFHHRVSEMLARWGMLKPLEEGDRVLYPGEPEEINRKHRLRAGIPLGLKLIEQLNAEATTLGVTPLRFELPEPKIGQVVVNRQALARSVPLKTGSGRQKT